MIFWLARSAMLPWFPRSEQLPGLEDLDVGAFLRRFQRDSGAMLWLGFLLGIAAFHLSPLFTVYLPVPAFALPASWRLRHAQRLSTHPVYLLRQTVFLVKMVAGLCWGAAPEVRRHFALPPYPQDPGTRRTA